MQHGITIDDVALTVEVEAEVFGRYIPASYFQPAEGPEVEVISVTVVEDEDESGQFTPGEDVVHLLDRPTLEEIEVAVLEYQDDQAAAAEEDYYDGLREDRALGLL